MTHSDCCKGIRRDPRIVNTSQHSVPVLQLCKVNLDGEVSLSFLSSAVQRSIVPTIWTIELIDSQCYYKVISANHRR